MECISCGVADVFLTNTGDFMTRLISNIRVPLTYFLGAVAAVWIVIQGGKLALRQADLLSVFTDALFLGMGLALLEAMQLGFMREIYDALVSVMFSVSAMAMGEAPGSTPANTAGLLIMAVERALMTPINMLLTLFENAGVLEAIKVGLYVAFVLIPILFMLVLVIKHQAINLFRVTLIMILSPFIIGFSSFPWGRQLWSTAISQITSGVLVMFAVSGAFAFVIDAVSAPFASMGELSPGEIAEHDMLLVTTTLFAWAGVFLINEAASIANALAGSSLSIIRGNIPNLSEKFRQPETPPQQNQGGGSGPTSPAPAPEKVLSGPTASDGSPDLSDGYGNHTGMTGSGRKSTHSDDFTTDKSKL